MPLRTMNRKIFTRWRDRLVSIQGFLYLAAFQLLFSITYITFFSVYFRFNKSLIVVHLFLVIGIIIITTFLMGLPLLSKAVRSLFFAKNASEVSVTGEPGCCAQTKLAGCPIKAPFLICNILPEPTQSPWLSV